MFLFKIFFRLMIDVRCVTRDFDRGDYLDLAGFPMISRIFDKFLNVELSR